MNTYDVSVKNKVILKEVPEENLKESVKLIQAYTFLFGGSNKDVKVSSSIT